MNASVLLSLMLKNSQEKEIREQNFLIAFSFCFFRLLVQYWHSSEFMYYEIYFQILSVFLKFFLAVKFQFARNYAEKARVTFLRLLSKLLVYRPQNKKEMHTSPLSNCHDFFFWYRLRVVRSGWKIVMLVGCPSARQQTWLCKTLRLIFLYLA